MHSALEISYYIVKELGEMTTMKMQKLLYYAQAWSLVWDEEPLFEEDFQAWANGPVCEEVFHAFRGKYRINTEDFVQKSQKLPKLSNDQKETIDSVLAFYGDKAPHWLSELTHQEEPWNLARKGISMGEPSTAIITKESMNDYYGKISG